MIHIGPYTNQIKHTPTGIAASGTIRNAQVKTPTLRLRHHGKMPTTTGTNRKIMQNNVLVISQLLSTQFQLASVFAIRSTDETKSDIRRLGKHRLRYLLSLPCATDNLSDIFHFPYFKHYSSPTLRSIVSNFFPFGSIRQPQPLILPARENILRLPVLISKIDPLGKIHFKMFCRLACGAVSAASCPRDLRKSPRT